MPDEHQPSEKEREIFNEALEIQSPEKRAAYLDIACKGEPPSFRVSIEKLLQAASLRGKLHEIPPAVQRPHVPTAKEPGVIIGGRYELVYYIHMGGMGEVWMAWQEKPFSRAVAIKFIKQTEGPRARELDTRFKTEGQALASLGHPNIATIFDAAFSMDDITDPFTDPFIVMELVEQNSAMKWQPSKRFNDPKLGLKVTDFCNTFSDEEIKDLPMFVNKLRQQSDPVSGFLWRESLKQGQEMPTNYQPSALSSGPVKDFIIQHLNRIILGPSIYETIRFQGISLRPETQNLLKLTQHLLKQDPDAKGAEFVRLNRMLLEDAYSRELSTKSSRKRLDLFLQICEAVQYAHEPLVPVIHRDLKPGNILVTLANGQPIVKVIDFGIAKLVAQPTESGAGILATSACGTLGYASPEQLTGGQITKASDIYSLGVLLCELLTDERPYTNEELNKLLNEREQQKSNSMTLRLPPPTVLCKRIHRNEAVFMKWLGRIDLKAIVVKCLERPEDPYYEVKDVITDIKATLCFQPVKAYKQRWLLYLLCWYTKFLFRHKLAAAVTLALLLGVVGSTWQARRAQASENREEAEAFAADMVIANGSITTGRQGYARNLLERHANHQTNWVWRYLRGRCQRDPSTLILSNGNEIASVASSS